jgi:sulfur-carrier protein
MIRIVVVWLLGRCFPKPVREDNKMNVVTIIVPQSLRGFVDGADCIEIEAVTVRQAIIGFVAHSDALRSHLLDDTNALKRFVRVLVDDAPLMMPLDEDRPLRVGAQITVLLALAGG